MVIAPTNTGTTVISRYAMISYVQQNIGIFVSVIPGACILRMVTTVLVAPIVGDASMVWIAKIAVSIPEPVYTDNDA